MTRLFVLIAGLCTFAFGAQAENQDRYLIIGSYLAEIVVTLGDADRIVGIGGGMDHIRELEGVPTIRGFRNTSAEPMLSLGPTVALMAGRQTRPEVVEQLEGAGVAVHVFPDDVASLDVVPARIGRIGNLLGREQEAAALAARFEAELEDTLAFVAGAKTRPRGLFILSGGGRPTLVAGDDTHIALLIDLAGAENVTDGITYFKPMSQEAMLKAAPDFILVNEEGLELSGGVPVALKAPGAALTPAGQSGAIFALPSGYLTGLGLNSPKAIRAIAERVHPELAGKAE
ncbi:MAG: ABC transporter substrate-binding protein [Minwuiales bacterium]|nr:ABC transporter substrate-binding protein [Minwuiales bacterium]